MKILQQIFSKCDTSNNKRVIDDVRPPMKHHDKLRPIRRTKSLQELTADRANSRRFINLRSNRDLARAPIKLVEKLQEQPWDESRSAEDTVHRFSRRVLVKNWPDVSLFDTRS